MHPLDPFLTSGLSRRSFFERCGMGFGLLGLAGISDAAAAVVSSNGASPLIAHPPQFAGKAKRVIHLFANGGPSQVDTFDPKPELSRLHGKALTSGHLKTERPTGAAFGSPFSFAKYGRCGTAPLKATAEKIPRFIASTISGLSPTLMGCAPIISSTGRPACTASAMACATARKSCTAKNEGRALKNSVKLPPRTCGRAKASTATLLKRSATGNVRILEKSRGGKCIKISN